MDTATLPSTDPALRSPVPTAPPVAPAVASTSRVRAAADRARRLLRGPEADPSWARPALIALLVLTAAAYLSNLTASGWANAFYSAAAQAGADSWSAFFWGSFDASNAITVDKPPAALWVMALSVRLFGLSSLAILLPQVLMGVGTVAVVHATVRRRFSPGAGLLAGAALALTPVAVLMFRFNNPDALLTLLMALAAWATLHAVDKGSIRWMALAGVFVGFGFLTKTLQVLLVVPALGIAWVLFADTTIGRRLLGSLAAVGAMVAAAGWWVAVVELVPANLRPYVGGSQTDSFLELTFGYNGLGRLDGTEVGKVGGGGGGGFSADVGLLRMFDSSVGGQISWLLPAALLLLVAGVAFRGRAPRTDPRRAAYVVLGGWLLVTALTFSLMQGIFHEYYTVALAPAIAALVGMGAAEAWERRDRPVGAAVLAAATAASTGWAFVLLSRTTEYGGWLRFLVLAVGIAAAALLLLAARLHHTGVRVAAALAVVASLAGPVAYAATTLSTGHTGSIVTAGPSTGRGPGGGGIRGGMPGGAPGMVPGGTTAGPGAANGTAPTAPGAAGATGGRQRGMGGLLDATTPDAEVVAALRADAGSYTWVAAAVGSQNAAGLQLASEQPVMAIGGFNGSDPAPTLAEFQAYVADGRIHYFLPGGGFGNQNGGSSASSEIAAWVAAGFPQVTIGSQTFYDLTAPAGGSAS